MSVLRHEVPASDASEVTGALAGSEGAPDEPPWAECMVLGVRKAQVTDELVP